MSDQISQYVLAQHGILQGLVDMLLEKGDGLKEDQALATARAIAAGPDLSPMIAEASRTGMNGMSRNDAWAIVMVMSISHQAPPNIPMYSPRNHVLVPPIRPRRRR